MSVAARRRPGRTRGQRTRPNGGSRWTRLARDAADAAATRSVSAAVQPSVGGRRGLRPAARAVRHGRPSRSAGPAHGSRARRQVPDPACDPARGRTGRRRVVAAGRAEHAGRHERETFVIVGASLAGAKAAETLREEGFTGRVVLIGEETEPPYERPPLSKGYLLGNDPREKAFVHEPHWYAEHDIELAARHRRRGRSTSPTGRSLLHPQDAVALRQAAAGHRIPRPPAGRARRRRCRACTTCARWTSPTPCWPRSRERRTGGGRRRRLDRPGDRRGRPVSTAAR